MSDPQSAVSDPRPSMLAIPIPKPELPKHLRDEPTVVMLFPRKLSLNLDEYLGLVHFEKGLQEVPMSLATDYPKTKDNQTGMHWYLAQQGVQRYEAPEPTKPAMPEVTEHHVAFLQSRGYAVATIAGAQVFAEQLTDKERAGFFAEAVDWKPKKESTLNIQLTEKTVSDVALVDMTKAQIVAHAFEEHGLELDASQKKDELIAAVEAHVAEQQS